MRKLFLLITILLFTASAFSQSPATTGSLGLFHSQESRVLMPGRWSFWANYNFFSSQGDYLGQPAQDSDAEKYSEAAANLSVSYGILKNMDATLGIRAYQKTNHPNESNVPDDLFLTVKAGSFNFSYGHFAGAFWGTVLFPTGNVHNYPWAMYSSGSVEFGLFGGLSYYYNAYLPDKGLAFHFNAGWWNHNEKGKEIDIIDETTRTATQSSSELRMMMGASVPAGPFNFMIEFWGATYTVIPESFVYSAEDYAFLSPAVRYRVTDLLAVDLGVDVRVSPGDRQRTHDVPDLSAQLDLPKNYPPWRIQVGLSFDILPAGVRSQYGGEAVDDPLLKRRLEFYEHVMAEKQRTDVLQRENEEIRDLREEAAEEIDKIRNELEY